MTLPLPREPGPVVLLDPEQPERVLVEPGVPHPGPTTGARPIYQGRFDGTDAAEEAEPDLER